MEITHLQYEDDTLVFCEAQAEQTPKLRIIFVIFEAIPDFHIKWGKSLIYLVNNVLVRKLGQQTKWKGWGPSNYLSRHAFGS